MKVEKAQGSPGVDERAAGAQQSPSFDPQQMKAGAGAMLSRALPGARRRAGPPRKHVARKLRMLSPWSFRVLFHCNPAAKAWHPPRRALFPYKSRRYRKAPITLE